MKPLVDECVRSMLSNISIENSAKLLYYSDLYELKDLKKRVVKFICDGNTKAVIESAGWNEFVKIKPVLMEQIIEGMANLRC